MSSFQKIVLVILGVALGASVGGAPYLRKIRAIEQRVQVRIGNQFILSDVARTEKTRRVGLSERESLGINEGLLFIFDEPGLYSFWMKDMKFPIDIIWIKDNKIVGFSERVPTQPGAKTEELKNYYPPEEVDAVLEVTAGRVGLLRTGTGVGVEIRSFIPKVK